MNFEEWFSAKNLSGIPTHELRRFQQTWNAAQKAMQERAARCVDYDMTVDEILQTIRALEVR